MAFPSFTLRWRCDPAIGRGSMVDWLRSRIWPGLAAVVALLCWSTADPLAAEPSRESDLKAMFLYHLPSFVEWPAAVFAHEDSPFVIGVLGEDPFGRALDDLVATEYVGKHPFEIRRLRRVEEANSCHVLFIAGSERRRLEEILHRLRGRPVLTVGDLPGFAEAGGMVGFGVRDNHLQLFVNPQAARAVELTVSSKLLELAEIVDAFALAP